MSISKIYEFSIDDKLDNTMFLSFTVSSNGTLGQSYLKNVQVRQKRFDLSTAFASITTKDELVPSSNQEEGRLPFHKLTILEQS